MKQRLLEAIYKKIDENPNNENLQRQIMLLSRAHICTIHSFCLDVIRNNFFELGISANFRVADASEVEIMKQEIIEEIFEKKYEEQNEIFLKLLETYTTYKDDAPLKEIVLNTYEFTRCLPSPEIWLAEKIEEFNTKKDFAETEWGRLILKKAKETIEYIKENLGTAQRLTDKNVELASFFALISSDLNDINKIDTDNWDSIYEVISTKSWDSWPRKSKMSDESKELKERAKVYRDEAKSSLEEISKYLTCTSKEATKDLNKMYPVLKGIEDLTLEFTREFDKRKREKNIVDFSDIEHLALKLLVREDGTKSEIAERYEFEEIAIDEYQDSNLVQEKILNSVSNGKNIFMVGDVKQSIYRFRQARPDLFLDKYQTYEKIEEKKETIINEAKSESQEDKLAQNTLTQNTKIQLYNNFRSREEVLNITNLIFQNIMSKALGEIEYSKEEYLNFSANFEKPEIDCTAELCLIETENNEEMQSAISEENSANDLSKEAQKSASKEELNIDSEDEEVVEKQILEARLIAKKIKELKEKGLKYQDMAILLRSPGRVAPIYEKELMSNRNTSLFRYGIRIFRNNRDRYNFIIA